MTIKTAWFCVSCRGELDNHARMYNHGRCPKCGFKGKDACTIVDTYSRAYRIIKIPSGKWWIPDKKKRQFFGERHYD